MTNDVIVVKNPADPEAAAIVFTHGACYFSDTQNPQLFASAQGGGPSDGSNALALSQFAANPVSSLNGQSLNDYYNSIVSDVGTANASNKNAMPTVSFMQSA